MQGPIRGARSFDYVIITVSHQYGAGAISVATHAAELLGYEVVDRQLPVVVAKRLSITPEEIEAVEDSGRSLGERLLSSLEMSTPEVTAQNFGETIDAAYIREAQNCVREYAAHGNVIIIGRASGLVLGRRPDVLRTFMHAPREWRIEKIASGLNVDEKTAAREVDRMDRARRAHLRDWYGADFGNPETYDLAIDTSSFSVEGSAQIVVAAVRARS